MNGPVSRRALAVAVSVAALSAGGSPRSSLAGWSMFHGDPAHSGYSTATTPAESSLAWTYPNADSIFYSSPVIAPNGRIYVGTLGEQLLAIDPLGQFVWSFDAGGNFRYSTPAIGASGTIYVGGGDGKLYAVNPDHSLAWAFSAGAPIKTSPNIGADGTIYFGCDDGKLYAVWPNGTRRWTFTAGDTIRSSPALAPDGTIYFGCEDAYLYAVWPDSTLRWRVATGAQIKFSSPAVSSSGSVYVGSYDGFLYAFTAGGGFQWAYFTNNPIRSSPAIGGDGTVFVGAGSKLFAIRSDGNLQWDYDTDGEVQSSPAYVAGRNAVCVGDDAGSFHVVHADDGGNDWTARVGSPIRSSPAPAANGNVYVADVSGKLWAFGTMPVLGVDPVGGQEPNAAALSIRASPNPSRGEISFEVRGAGAASRSPGPGRLLVFDLSGRRVVGLSLDTEARAVWSGKDDRGRPVAAGVYLIHLDGDRAKRGADARVVILP